MNFGPNVYTETGVLKDVRLISASQMYRIYMLVGLASQGGEHVACGSYRKRLLQFLISVQKQLVS